MVEGVYAFSPNTLTLSLQYKLFYKIGLFVRHYYFTYVLNTDEFNKSYTDNKAEQRRQLWNVSHSIFQSWENSAKDI